MMFLKSIVIITTVTASTAFAPTSTAFVTTTSSRVTALSSTTPKSNTNESTWQDSVSKVQQTLSKARKEFEDSKLLEDFETKFNEFDMEAAVKNQSWEESVSKVQTSLLKAQKDFEDSGILEEIETKFNEMDVEEVKKEVQQLVEGRINAFTGKDEYHLGDISKEVLRGVQEGEYKVEDVFLVVKMIATAGVNMNPLAQLFPIKVLVELLNYSLKLDVNARLNMYLAGEIDRRFKLVVEEKKSELGEYTKKALMEFTGKDKYEPGDVLQAVEDMTKDTVAKMDEIFALGDVNAANDELVGTIVTELDNVDEVIDEAEVIEPEIVEEVHEVHEVVDEDQQQLIDSIVTEIQAEISEEKQQTE